MLYCIHVLWSADICIAEYSLSSPSTEESRREENVVKEARRDEDEQGRMEEGGVSWGG